MDAENGCQMVCIDCWVESENRAGLTFFARRPPYRDFMWYVCPVCLEIRGNTSYTGRGGVTRENTTTGDSGGYVMGLHISASTRVGASLGSDEEESEPPAAEIPSGERPSQTPREAPATERPNGERPRQTPRETPATERPNGSPTSQLTK